MKELQKIVNKENYAIIKDDWMKQSGLTEGQFMKEVSFAIQQIKSNPLIAECDQHSVLKSVLNTAQTGLTLNPVRKEAYLVPRWNYKTGAKECCLDPSYMGLAKLLTDSGAVKHIEANIVYEGDNVDIDYSSEEKIKKHVPYIFTGKPKGEIIAVYSIATLADGTKHIEVMSKEDVIKIRDMSEGYKAFKSGKVKQAIWDTWEDQMFRKTVIKRHFKFLPKSSKEQIDKVIDIDNQVNFRQPMTFVHRQTLEKLIDSSILDENHKQKLNSELDTMEYRDEADMMYDYLLDNQQDDMSQTGINKQLDRVLDKD